MSGPVSELASATLPTWDLSDLYDGVGDSRLDADMASCTQRAVAFETRFKGTICVDDLSATHLRVALDEYEALLRDRFKPEAFASLLFSTDTRDPERGALLQKAREFGSSVATHLVFFDIEIGEIRAATYDRLIADESIGPYRHYLDHERDLAAHNLSEAEEKILVKTSNARGRAFARLATEINGRTMFEIELAGGTEKKTQSEILSLLYDPDRRMRAKAASAITGGLRGNAHTGTFIYNTLLHEKDVLDRLRGYDSPEASRHLNNELDGGIVDTVSDVCVANYDVVSDYYRLKGKLLGIDDLTHYDRYAPVAGGDTRIDFDRAREMVVNSFRGFSSPLGDMADSFFERGWIDAALADGKRGGAYCAGVTPDHHPYVFMNYTGQPRDVMTLAHELGHGVHDILASSNHLLDYHPVLPLAETASTFAEMLLFDSLLGELDSDRERLTLLCSKIEDTFATVFRQIAMFRFELLAHRARRERGELTTEKLSELWQHTMQQMFGDSLKLGDEHACWWLYIPHIVDAPFYVYAYAFGELLVLALYARYRQEGDSFVERYTQLLSAGGSQTPAELTSRLGIDISDGAFWQGGCDLIRERVAEATSTAAAL